MANEKRMVDRYVSLNQGDTLEDLFKKYPTALIEIEYNWDNTETYLTFKELETDEEYQSRLESEKRIRADKRKSKEKTEQKERELLEKLKAKYET